MNIIWNDKEVLNEILKELTEDDLKRLLNGECIVTKAIKRGK